MRFLMWMLLLGLSSASVLSGQLTVALVLAGLKASFVGWEFMELRTAARLHQAVYALYVLGCAGGLLLGAL